MTNTETRIIAAEVVTARAAIEAAKDTGDIVKVESACREQVRLLLAIEGKGIYERAPEAVKLANVSGDPKLIEEAEDNLKRLIDALGHSSGDYIKHLREQAVGVRAEIVQICKPRPTFAETIATETQHPPL